MKQLLKLTLAVAITTLSVTGHAQKIRLEDGNLDFLKNEKSVNVEFVYENVKVGKYDNEKDYIDKKKEDMNKKEAGTGDKWAKAWIDDRDNRYKPKFEELFTKNTPLQVNDKGNSKYTLVYKTTFLEPGYNIGISRKNAQHNAEVFIVEAANKNKVLARITLDKALGRDFWGADFDTGARLAETYADAGKALAKFIEKQTK
ncbi:hypothetical protein [Pinibacter aurantiacus]|uniref:DUF4468 domain-containing protein n=1 Tax=Pinibacter aurantiacus TaxID=2851599 RepID=A0A9E2SBF6_9BACT|nr:hypothetical protein [Pinibacter aurantiacus]MBV4356800.1 hypothetical protein [Pinibacter aurantiacus]